MGNFITTIDAVLFAVLLAGSSCGDKASGRLSSGFIDPPDDAKPRVFWWWLEGNISEEGILRDLTEMKNAGIQGAIVFDAGTSHYYTGGEITHFNNLRTEPGPGFMSDEWRKLFTYACRTADSLNMELSMNITSGWNDGGPWVEPDLAAKKLVWSEMYCDGGQHVSAQFPTPDNLYVTDNGETFYRHIVTLAVRLTDNADSVRSLENLSIKAVKSIGIPMTVNGTGYDWNIFMKDEPSKPGDCHAYLTGISDISDKVDSAGKLDWKLPNGRYLLLRFGYTSTGVKVSTHSPGAGGLAIDYMSRRSMKLQYDRTAGVVVQDLKKAKTGKSLKYLHDDSWELGAANWTEDMQAFFRMKNKYDLYKYLPVIAGKVIDSREASNRFLYDFRRTIADLIARNHYLYLSELAKKDGFMTHPESGGPHPAPIDALQNEGINDIPMGEFWIRANTHRVEPHRRLYVKQPASAAHIYGRRFVQAEGPTSIGLHWEEDFYYMKPTLDRVYCEGLNRLVIHTFTHSPKEAGKPGNEYFAGTHFNPNVTWWKQAHSFLTWNSRVSHMLSQGLFVGDICYYYGDNVPNQVPLKHYADEANERGYDYDVCNTEVILNRMKVKNGRICLPDGMSYAVLVLPDMDAIRPEVLKKISRLVEQGASIVGKKPKTSVGLRNAKYAKAEVAELANELWGRGDGIKEGEKRSFGKGTVYSGVSPLLALNDKGIPKDFYYGAPKMLFAPIDYIHRRTKDADIYYIANQNEYQKTFYAYFRVKGKAPEFWYPETGNMCYVPAYDTTSQHTFMPITLESFGSVFVVFRHPERKHYVDIKCCTISIEEYLYEPGRKLYDTIIDGESLIRAMKGKHSAYYDREFPYTITEDGKILLKYKELYGLTAERFDRHRSVNSDPQSIEIAPPWEVSFVSEIDDPMQVRFDSLVRWDEHPDPAIHYFSGTAEYARTFNIDTSSLQGKCIYLSLGKVYNMAEVFVNDRPAGVWWTPPFARDVTPLLHHGENKLLIKVVNLWPNRLIGDARLPEAQRRTKTNIIKFTVPNKPLMPSGLVGPVMINAYDVAE